MKKKKIGIIAMQNSHQELEDEKYTRFPEELSKMGHEYEILFFDKFFVHFGDDGIEFFYNEEKFNPFQYDLFLPIVGGNRDSSLILEALEADGHKLKNNFNAVSISKDKGRTALNLKKAGLPTVDSGVNFSQFFLTPLMDSLGGDEYICKLREGSLGKGVSYIKSRLSLISVFELIVSSGVKPAKIIFEKFIKESAGRDYRVIVAGGEVLSAMERSSNGFDFRANLWGGGDAKKIEPDKDMLDAAIKATNSIGLDYAGVDFVVSDKGPLIIEVNSNPGLLIEKCTGDNISRGILEQVINS